MPALSNGHSVLFSPAVAGNGPHLQVPVSEGIHPGTQPLTPALVHGVQNVDNLITFHWQGAAVQLAGDVQVEADVKGVPRGDEPFLYLWQQLAVPCREGRGEAGSHTLLLLYSLWERPQHKLLRFLSERIVLPECCLQQFQQNHEPAPQRWGHCLRDSPCCCCRLCGNILIIMLLLGNSILSIPHMTCGTENSAKTQTQL